MESIANSAAYFITFATAAISGIAISDTPVGLFGIAWTSLVAGAIPFSEPPLKYIQLSFAIGYLSGMTLYVAHKTMEKRKSNQ